MLSPLTPRLVCPESHPFDFHIYPGLNGGTGAGKLSAGSARWWKSSPDTRKNRGAGSAGGYRDFVRIVYKLCDPINIR